MPKAIWKGAVLAQSEQCELIEGNVYFPPDALDHRYVSQSETTSVCSWKGTASYYTVQVGDEINVDAAWTYRDPLEAAAHIKDYVAFWRGVEIES